MSAPRCCQHWIDGQGICGTAGNVRVYLPGPRCPHHTPAQIAGRPDTTPDPTLTLAGLRHAAGIRVDYAPPTGPTAIDRAAIASGKRRAAPRDYQAAREAR